jgi:uncharacterized membrane protein HdeD (DUF308 family)
MKDIILSFLSVAAIVGGITILGGIFIRTAKHVRDSDSIENHWVAVFIGVVLLAFGLTRFYMRSRLKKD